MAFPASSAGTTIATVALLAAGAAFWVAAGSRKAPPVDDDGDLASAASLEGRLHDVEGRLEKAQERLSAIEPRLARVERLAEAALQRAEAAEALARQATSKPVPGTAATDQPLAVPSDAAEKRKELDLVLATLREGSFNPDTVFGLVNRAKELGGIDEALAEIEKFTQAHPADAAALVSLGTAYAAKLLTVPDGPERGAWAMKGVDAYDRALKIEPENWDAQFYRSFNLSQWPAFLNKKPEAIRGFETLVEQQEKRPVEPRFAQTYVQLGILYQAVGNGDRARAVFRKGLDLFPDNKALREQIDLLEKR